MHFKNSHLGFSFTAISIEQNPIYILSLYWIKNELTQWIKSRQRVSEMGEKRTRRDDLKTFFAHHLTSISTMRAPTLVGTTTRSNSTSTSSHNRFSSIFHLNIIFSQLLLHFALNFLAHHVHLFFQRGLWVVFVFRWWLKNLRVWDGTTVKIIHFRDICFPFSPSLELKKSCWGKIVYMYNSEEDEKR